MRRIAALLLAVTLLLIPASPAYAGTPPPRSLEIFYSRFPDTVPATLTVLDNFFCARPEWDPALSWAAAADYVCEPVVDATPYFRLPHQGGPLL